MYVCAYVCVRAWCVSLCCSVSDRRWSRTRVFRFRLRLDVATHALVCQPPSPASSLPVSITSNSTLSASPRLHAFTSGCSNWRRAASCYGGLCHFAALKSLEWLLEWSSRRGLSDTGLLFSTLLRFQNPHLKSPPPPPPMPTNLRPAWPLVVLNS